MATKLDRKKFFDEVRIKLFHGNLQQDTVEGIGAILDAWEKWLPGADWRWQAYALGTARRECGDNMKPIEEFPEGRRGKAYNRPAGPFMKLYFGRGIVQLTWLRNYQKADAELHKRGVLTAAESLVKNPELALREDVAAAIMVLGMAEGWFTGHSLATFFNGHTEAWREARTIINGHDHADEVAGYGRGFYAAIQHSLVAA